MKKLLFTSALIALVITSYSQAPNAFNYQAVIRDNSGSVISNQNISLRVNIMKGTESGESVYTEIHLVNSGDLGIINLIIGEGNVIGGSIADIDWGSDSYLLKVEADLNAGTNYESLVESRLLSVPYALYATSSGVSGSLTELKVDYITSTPSCNGESDGSVLLSVTGGKPPYLLEWSNGESSNSLENIKSGTYSVTVSDDAGQFVSRQIILSEPSPLSVSFSANDITCNGYNDGHIIASVNGGNGGYVFAWSNGETSSSLYNCTPGDYTLTVTDSKNCTANSSISLIEPAQIVIVASVTDVTCFGENTGSIDIVVSGGYEQYQYNWSYGSYEQDISNVPMGSYTVTVRDAGNCSVSETYEVGVMSPEIIMSAAISNIKCKNDSDGAIDLAVEGGSSPYSYSWSNGSTTQDLTGLSAGSYSVTTTDSEGCQHTENYSVTEPSSEIVVTYTTQDEFKNESDGSIDLTISGGVPNYNVSWSNGKSTEDIDLLSSGTYTYTISDANECTVTGNLQIERVESVADIDGNVYDIVKINDQIWMAENLKTTKFNDDWIITDLRYPGYDISNVNSYGLLYPIAAVKTEKLCPANWRIATRSEWNELIDFLYGWDLAGGSLKETETTYWESPNVGATNQSGFGARGAGYNGSFLLRYAGFWAGPHSNYETSNYVYILDARTTGVNENFTNSGYYSVRCIKE